MSNPSEQDFSGSRSDGSKPTQGNQDLANQDLVDLGKRIKAAQRAHDPEQSQRAGNGTHGAGAGAGIGLRIAVDLVAGIAVGVGIGWWLDKVLETKPWLLLVFTVVGFCAGLLNVVRTANQLEARRKEEEAALKREQATQERD